MPSHGYAPHIWHIVLQVDGVIQSYGKITNDPHAFQICQDYITFEMVHESKQPFWDGYGKQRDAQYFHEAEIIVDLKSSVYSMFKNVLEGLSENTV